MKPETRLDIAVRHVAEAEAAVIRQKQLIEELEEEGHPTRGSRILLRLLEDSSRNAQKALDTFIFSRGL